MAEKTEIALYVSAKDEATRVLKGVEQQVGLSAKQMRNAGMGITAGGVAIVGALGMAAKAAADEEVGIVRLTQAMKNMGLSYEEAVNQGLEKWIDGMQQSTSFADSDMRDALSTLITMTGDLSEAQDLLTVAMDISAGTGDDLASSTSKLGYALSGNWGMVERMIPALKEAQTEEEKWMMLRSMFKDQAEAYGNTLSGQMNTLKNNLGDIAEAIGGPLIEALSGLMKNLQPVIQGIKQWMSDNSKAVKTIVMVAGAVGALMLVVGPLLIALAALPAIMAGIGTAMTLATGPIGLIILAITALVAAGIALWQNWDKVKDWFADLWDNIKIIFATAVEWIVKTVLQPFFFFIDEFIGSIVDGLGKIVGFFNKEWGEAITEVADTLHNLDDEIIAWTDNIKTSAEANKEARATVRELEDGLKAQEKAANDAAGALSDYSDAVTKVQLASGELVDLTETSVRKSTYTPAGGGEAEVYYYRGGASSSGGGNGVAVIDSASLNSLGKVIESAIEKGDAALLKKLETGVSSHVTLEMDGKELANIISQQQYSALKR